MLHEVPSLDGGVTVLDTIALFDTITKRGGVRRVQEQSLWKEVKGSDGVSTPNRFAKDDWEILLFFFPGYER